MLYNIRISCWSCWYAAIRFTHIYIVFPSFVVGAAVERKCPKLSTHGVFFFSSWTIQKNLKFTVYLTRTPVIIMRCPLGTRTIYKCRWLHMHGDPIWLVLCINTGYIRTIIRGYCRFFFFVHLTQMTKKKSYKKQEGSRNMYHIPSYYNIGI